LDENIAKEQFSRAYVNAVASCAKINASKPEIDEDSIDIVFSTPGVGGTLRAPRLEAQLKCTAQDILKENHLSFSLSKKNHEELRAENVIVPRILIVVLVPRDPKLWIHQTEDHLGLKHCGYWLSLRGFSESGNKSMVTVELPRKNMFSPDSLGEIMKKIGQGRFP